MTVETKFSDAALDLIKIQRPQRTLKKEAKFSGIGLHTGHDVVMRFCPAPEGTGIKFQRSDLPGKPIIPATVDYVQSTARSTNIGIGNVRVYTVEHVLAALRAYRVDNLVIDVSGPEPPVGNGSSDVFVEMIEDTGIVEQDGMRPVISLKSPISWTDSEAYIVAVPYDGYKISYTLHYPESSAIGTQFFELEVGAESFKREIAPCRTFAKYEEVSLLMDRGLIKGGSLDNAVVVKDDVVLSKEGLKFPDEMVRHKILDLIGDLSLVGFDFHAHVLAVRTGHTSNVEFARELYKNITVESP